MASRNKRESLTPLQRSLAATALAGGASLETAAAIAGVCTATASRIAGEHGLMSLPAVRSIQDAAATLGDALLACRERLGSCADPAQWQAAADSVQPLREILAARMHGCRGPGADYGNYKEGVSKSIIPINEENPVVRAARATDRLLADAVAAAPPPRTWAEIERLARVRASINGPARQPIVAGGGRETPVIALVALPSPAARATEGVVLDVYTADKPSSDSEEP